MNTTELNNALEAIEQLSARNRAQPDSAIERQLIDLRVQAFNNTAWPVNNSAWPPVYSNPFTADKKIPAGAIPEINREQLNSNTLAAGVLEYGSLLVRNFVPAEKIELLKNDIEEAVNKRNLRVAGEIVVKDDPHY